VGNYIQLYWYINIIACDFGRKPMPVHELFEILISICSWRVFSINLFESWCWVRE